MNQTGGAYLRVIIYVACFFTPFTSLRFGLIGPGEILFGVSFLLLLVHGRGRTRIGGPLAPLVQFWAFYLFAISLGFFYNAFLLQFDSGTLSGAAFDFFSYVFILSVLLVLGDGRIYLGTSPERFFKNVFLIWTITFVVLYVLSRQTEQILGLPLRYYTYFSPLVENVHQAAMLTCAMPFIVFYLASRTPKWSSKTILAVAGLLFAAMAIESGSTKALMGLVVGLVATALFYLWGSLAKTMASRALVLALLVAATAMTVFLKWDYATALAINFFLDNDGSGARENLYGLGLELGLNTPVFGRGPGPHISYAGDGDYSDAHNTVLTVFLQGGVLGLVAVVLCLKRFFRLMSAQYFLVGAVCAVGMYLLGGDILRRLPIWILIAGVLYFSSSAFGQGGRGSPVLR